MTDHTIIIDIKAAREFGQPVTLRRAVCEGCGWRGPWYGRQPFAWQSGARHVALMQAREEAAHA